MHVRNAEIPFLHGEIVFRKYSETHITSYTKSIIAISHIKNVKLIIRRLVNRLVWNFLIYFTGFIMHAYARKVNQIITINNNYYLL